MYESNQRIKRDLPKDQLMHFSVFHSYLGATAKQIHTYTGKNSTSWRNTYGLQRQRNYNVKLATANNHF